MAKTAQATSAKAPPPPQPPAAPKGRLIERGFGPGTLRPGVGDLVRRGTDPEYCGAIVGRAFGYTEHPNSRDASKLSYRFAGQFIGIKFDGSTMNTNEAYLPSAIQSTLLAALNLQKGTQLAQPIEFSVEVWCEPLPKPPYFTYVCYDRRQQKPNDPLLMLAYESGLIERPAVAVTDQSGGGNRVVDPETGEISEAA